MKTLSQALENIKITAEPLTKNSDLLNTQAAGSTQEVGRMNIQLQSNQGLNPNISEQKKPLALRDDSVGKGNLSKLLLISFDVLDTFGKEAEQLENINLAFQMYLEEYSYTQIERAFKQYMRTNSVLPKPSDIIRLIETPVAKRTMLTPGEEAARKRLQQKYGVVQF